MRYLILLWWYNWWLRHLILMWRCPVSLCHLAGDVIACLLWLFHRLTNINVLHSKHSVFAIWYVATLAGVRSQEEQMHVHVNTKTCYAALSTRRRGTSTMMHSVNWPNDTCVGWMIKTMVPVRWGDIYYRWIKPELGFNDAHGKSGTILPSWWLPFSLFIILSFVYCRVSLFIVASLCLVLCLVVYYVCFVPSWWLIVAFILISLSLLTGRTSSHVA